MPGEVTLTHQVGKEYMPVTGGSQLAYVLLEAQPTEMMAQVRMPLNFALVLDHSGSMKGAKLKNVKEAVKMVIDRLEPTDYVSVVIFDDTSQVIIPSMPANDKPGMKAAIDQIRDAGGTTMSLGMIQGLNELRRWNIPHAINRMILLTDGVTYGDSERCRQLARDAAAAGIAIYPLGIGSDWDEDLLDTVGQLSGGMPAEFIRVTELRECRRQPAVRREAARGDAQRLTRTRARDHVALELRELAEQALRCADHALARRRYAKKSRQSPAHHQRPWPIRAIGSPDRHSVGRPGERQTPVRPRRIDDRPASRRSLPHRTG